MPAGMQNLLVKIKGVQLHRIPKSTLSILHSSLLARQRPNLFHFEGRFVRLQYDVLQGIGIVYPEIVMVRTR